MLDRHGMVVLLSSAIHQRVEVETFVNLIILRCSFCDLFK